MNKLNITSEIGRLKKVLVHEPGKELENLVPNSLQELLFDDIPWLPLAKKEHQAFVKTFRDNGVEVVYLVDLVSEALNTDLSVKKEFIDEFIKESGIYGDRLSKIVENYLLGFKDTKVMVLKTMAGIKKEEIKEYQPFNLADLIGDFPFLTDPMPNLYFTRDPFTTISAFVSLHKMYSKTRSRETIYAKYIFKYHPEYKNTKLVYDRNYDYNIEGGDILVLNKHTLIIGQSERTTPQAIEKLAKNLFFNNNTTYDNILVFSIPKYRTFMHLDTIFTQVDFDKFTIHKECYPLLKIFEITKDNDHLKIIARKESLEDILEEKIGKKVILIPCGGLDKVNADREQWSDGSNCVALAPGEVITYERNDITNQVLKEYNIKVHTIPSSELSRGRGGPRCMCMPLVREEIED